MSYVSPAATEKLNRPLIIRYSLPKLLFRTIVLAGVGGGFLVAAIAIYLRTPSGGTTDPWVWGVLGIAALCFFALARQCIPIWRSLGQPALTISRQGLTFRDKAPILWADIESNEWWSQGSAGLTTGAAAIIHAAGRKIKIDTYFLKCNGDEYAHYCELYASAAQEP